MNQTTQINQGYWYTILVWVAVAALCLEFSAHAAERWLPGKRDFEIASMRGECSIYRAVISKTQQQYSEKQTLLRELVQEAKLKRVELDRCAQEKGLLSLTSDQQEVFLAEACRVPYDQWLLPGYGIELVREDLQNLHKDLETARSHVQLKCPKGSI